MNIWRNKEGSGRVENHIVLTIHTDSLPKFLLKLYTFFEFQEIWF